MHYYTLDFMRFLCACYVFIYHVFFRSVGMGQYNDGLYQVVDWTKYGWIGVQIFFVISGFVIYKSSLNKTFKNFILNRFLRLFPAYWICLIITTTFMFIFAPIWWELNIVEILVNTTMFQSFLGIKHVDGVYWSLTYELIFYFWVVIFIWSKKLYRLKDALFVFVLFSLYLDLFQIEIPKVVQVVFFLKYVPYFLIGICLSEIVSKKDIKNYCYILISLIAAYYQINHKVIDIETRSGESLNSIMPFIILFTALLLIYLATKVKVKSKAIQFYFSILGAASYPIYLLHQNISYSIIGSLYGAVNEYALFSSVFVLVLLLSLIMAKYFEPMLRAKLKNLLINVF